ncbi:hypothetical protein X777_00359 [Ooceraea biroi]|uniref:Uncharacterized protein n=1 Tax=Ooceraea biroi TaxID=2015173 RepID=A0A026WV29_OOCBI|nr:hypothetical protein X777_00359 [Ooceraea biroi]
MTARLHSLRHQEKKSAGSSHRQHHQHQQAVHQGPSPAPSPSPSLSPSPKHSDGRRVSKTAYYRVSINIPLGKKFPDENES